MNKPNPLCGAPIALAALTIGGLAAGWKGAAAGFLAGTAAEAALGGSQLCDAAEVTHAAIGAAGEQRRKGKGKRKGDKPAEEPYTPTTDKATRG